LKTGSIREQLLKLSLCLYRVHPTKQEVEVVFHAEGLTDVDIVLCSESHTHTHTHTHTHSPLCV
jgi:hypothetical protein